MSHFYGSLCTYCNAHCYFAPSRGAKYCDERVCMSVCPSHSSKNDVSKLHEIFCLYVLSVVIAWSFSDDNAIRYVLPVLQMTSCFLIMGHMARGVGNNEVGAVLKQAIKISNVFNRSATLFDFVVVYSGSKWRTGAKCDVYDWLATYVPYDNVIVVIIIIINIFGVLLVRTRCVIAARFLTRTHLPMR